MAILKTEFRLLGVCSFVCQFLQASDSKTKGIEQFPAYTLLIVSLLLMAKKTPGFF